MAQKVLKKTFITKCLIEVQLHHRDYQLKHKTANRIEKSSREDLYHHITYYIHTRKSI